MDEWLEQNNPQRKVGQPTGTSGGKEKKRRRIKNILKILAAVVAFLGSLLGVLNHLGWLEPIKAFISKYF
jgi:hypothetical protein